MRDAAVTSGTRPVGLHRRAFLTAVAIVLAGVYFVLSLPVVRPAVEEQPELALWLAGGLVAVVGAAKAKRTRWRVALAIAAAYLLLAGSGEAWLIWLHGVAVFGLVAVVTLLARAADPFARLVGVATVGLVGVLVLGYCAFVLLILLGCGGEGCFS